MNIILQHWAGPLPRWAELAKQSFECYAKKIGADYELVRDYPMGKEHGPHTQKLVYLKEKYDKYDQTLMVDMDTVATNVCENVFDLPELYIGVLHDRAIQGTSRTPGAGPTLYKKGEPIYFGNWIKLTRDQRIALREQWDNKLLAEAVVDHYSGDEIVLHYLIHKSGILKNKSYNEIGMRHGNDLKERIENRLDRKFANQPEDSDPDASIIHFCRDRKKYIEDFCKTRMCK